MSLYYSDGSSKKGANSVYASFSSAKNSVNGLYYSNGSSKLPVWNGGNGNYFLFAYDNSNRTYKVNISTGASSLITSNYQIVPQQTFKNRAIQTGTTYQTMQEFDNNGTLVGEYSIGSIRSQINNGLPYSPGSDYVFTIKQSSTSTGKYNFFCYTFSTKSLRASASLFGAFAIFSKGNYAQCSNGTSSKLNEYIYNANSMSSVYTIVTDNSRHDCRTLPNNYGFVVANRSGTGSGYYELYQLNGSTWTEPSLPSISSRSQPSYTVMEDHLLVQTTTGGTNSVTQYSRLNYATLTYDYQYNNLPDGYYAGSGVAISKNRYVLIIDNNICIFQSNPSSISLISSVPVPSGLTISGPYTGLSDGGYLVSNNKY